MTGVDKNLSRHPVGHAKKKKKKKKNRGPKTNCTSDRDTTTISHKIFETNSSFHVISCEIAHYEKSLIAIFRDFFAGISKIFILAG